jgi:hypothetical protein
MLANLFKKLSNFKSATFENVIEFQLEWYCSVKKSVEAIYESLDVYDEELFDILSDVEKATSLKFWLVLNMSLSIFALLNSI